MVHKVNRQLTQIIAKNNSTLTEEEKLLFGNNCPNDYVK